MNKKIKVIELLNMVANEEKLPKKIKYGEPSLENKIYKLSNVAYIDYTTNFGGTPRCLFSDHNTNILNDYVEILEDKEEIDIENIKELEYLKDYEADKTDIRLNRDKINELIKCVKQLDRKINKE